MTQRAFLCKLKMPHGALGKRYWLFSSPDVISSLHDVVDVDRFHLVSPKSKRMAWLRRVAIRSNFLVEFELSCPALKYCYDSVTSPKSHCTAISRF